jgi:hypothetical protein
MSIVEPGGLLDPTHEQEYKTSHDSVAVMGLGACLGACLVLVDEVGWDCLLDQGQLPYAYRNGNSRRILLLHERKTSKQVIAVYHKTSAMGNRSHLFTTTTLRARTFP